MTSADASRQVDTPAALANVWVIVPMEVGPMALKDWQRVGADRMVSNALRVFDMRDDPDRVHREWNMLARSARTYGEETLAFAIDRRGELLDVNPRDEMAARALELLTEVREELGAGAS